MTKDDAVLESHSNALADINREISKCTDSLSPDLAALLIRKNAITQQVFQEMGQLIKASSSYLAEYLELKNKCREWQELFLIPLLNQSTGKSIDQQVDTDDLQRIVDEISRKLDD